MPGIIASLFLVPIRWMTLLTFFVNMGMVFQHLLWKFTHVHVGGFLWKSMLNQRCFPILYSFIDRLLCDYQEGGTDVM